MNFPPGFNKNDLTEVEILKCVYSEGLHRDLIKGETVQLFSFEADRRIGCGDAKITDPTEFPELDTGLCSELLGDDQHQCKRKPGYGPNEDYCKQHAKLHEAETTSVDLNIEIDIQEQV